jgi:hypothetical protein
MSTSHSSPRSLWLIAKSAQAFVIVSSVIMGARVDRAK